MIDVWLVVYRPALEDLRQTFAALAAAAPAVPIGTVWLWHNDAGAAETPGLAGGLAAARAAGLRVESAGGEGNLGFGVANNRLLERSHAPFVLLLNQDAIPEPGALEHLWSLAAADADDVAAWEMRQIPYEHPKDYDPVSLETGWCSGAALLLRRAAFAQVGGFEPRLFMYAEDVDLSWRLRASGWRLRYVPRAAVVHRTYRHAGEVKPLAAIEGAFANLCLRARYGRLRDMGIGMRALVHQLRGEQAFARRRRGLVRAALRFVRHAPYFRATRVRAPGFVPLLAGWDYERRREGAFHAFESAAERGAPLPAVAAVLRVRAGADLAERWQALLGQTHPPAAVWFVGEALPADAARPEPANGAPRCHVAPLRAGESLAAFACRSVADQPWVALFDDGELPYADHLEVLLAAARAADVPVARALCWDVELPADARHPGVVRALAPRSASRPAASLLARLDALAALAAGQPDDAPLRIDKTTLVRLLSPAAPPARA